MEFVPNTLDLHQPPRRNWLARSAVNRKVKVAPAKSQVFGVFLQDFYPDFVCICSVNVPRILCAKSLKIHL